MDKINQIFQFVIDTCDKYTIDESHGLKHSIDVFRYAEQIYQEELNTNSGLESKYQIIMYSAALHDMCDYKYIDEDSGLKRIVKFLYGDLHLDQSSIDLICKIITTMSYTKIKKIGFAQFSDPLDQLAYNIVREADLLTAYDFDRSVVYAMLNKKISWSDSVKETGQYFKIRVLTQISDGLFLTKFGSQKAQELHNQNLSKIYI
jgi:HD superfamily phosphodiesterase